MACLLLICFFFGLGMRRYLVQYDGLSANRSEWRDHADLISITAISTGRRRRQTVNNYAPVL